MSFTFPGMKNEWGYKCSALSISAGTAWRWNDCKSKKAFLCEYELTITKQTTTPVVQRMTTSSTEVSATVPITTEPIARFTTTENKPDFVSSSGTYQTTVVGFLHLIMSIWLGSYTVKLALSD